MDLEKLNKTKTLKAGKYGKWYKIKFKYFPMVWITIYKTKDIDSFMKTLDDFFINQKEDYINIVFLIE